MGVAEFVSEAVLNAMVVKEHYNRGPGSMTLCVLELRNGNSVLGRASVPFPDSQNEQRCNDLAREDAYSHLRELVGFTVAENQHVKRQVAEAWGADEDELADMKAAYGHVIAEVAFEVEREHRAAIGERVGPSWVAASEAVRRLAVRRVRYLLEHPEASPAETYLHGFRLYLIDKGEPAELVEYQAEQHTDYVPFDDLPIATRASYVVFAAVVRQWVRTLPFDLSPEDVADLPAEEPLQQLAEAQGHVPQPSAA